MGHSIYLLQLFNLSAEPRFECLNAGEMATCFLALWIYCEFVERPPGYGSFTNESESSSSPRERLGRAWQSYDSSHEKFGYRPNPLVCHHFLLCGQAHAALLWIPKAGPMSIS
jgi:hypothetical protein